MNNLKPKRIIFLDIMRAIAVLMMVQGHTIHTFLDHDLRTTDSVFYIIWFTMRGFTAPIFMFTAGVVFTYLLHLKTNTHNKTRLIKGLKRFILLVVLGYLLRYPTYKVFDFSDVTTAQWRIFFGVDALHLIGFGLLFIILLTLIAEKIKISPYVLLTVATLFFFLLYPAAANINWIEFLPAPVAAYFYTGSGSLFPFFPWAGYVLAGAIVGLYLAHHPLIYKEKLFGLKVITVGSVFTLVYFVVSLVSWNYFPQSADAIYKVNIISLRVGVVLLLNGIISIAAIRLENIPNIIKLIGRHTLIIYVVHLVILYGSAWVPGLYNDFGGTLNTIYSLLAVAAMYFLMGGMVYFIHKLNQLKRERVAAS